jgi:hypothetical protein
MPGGPSPYSAALPMMGMQAEPTAPGVGQTSSAIAKIGMEVDQALKLLLQAAPQRAQDIAQMIMLLRQIVSEASSGSGAGLIPDAGSLPDGSSRISGLGG